MFSLWLDFFLVSRFFEVNNTVSYVRVVEVVLVMAGGGADVRFQLSLWLS